ncbi:MAG: protein of unassigned function [Massilia sp.]|nr:protein of unassigned function [Massilia sp.]
MLEEIETASISAQTQTVLGRCTYAAPGIIRYEPLLLATDKGWQRILDAKSIFPETGRVFSPDAQGTLPRAGSLWVFTTEINRRYEGGRSLDRFLAREPKPPVQILDYTNMPAEVVRRQLVEIGLSTSQVPYAEVVVRLESNACVRLRLFTDEATGRHRADLDGLENLAVLKYIAAGADLDGTYFVVPGREPHEVIDRVDWSPDHEFLPKILKRIRRAGRESSQAPKAISLTNAAIDAITSFTRDSGIFSGDADGLRRMRQRTKDFLPQFQAGVTDLEAIVATLQAFAPVADRVKAEVAASRAEIEAELRRSLEPVVREELERRHADVAARIETALGEAAEAETMEAEARERVEALRRAAREVEAEATERAKALRRVELEVEAEATERVEALRRVERKVEAALAQEVGIVHDLLEAVPDDRIDRIQALARQVSDALVGAQVSADLVAPATPPWALGPSPKASVIGFGQLRDRLDAEADRNGLDATDLLALDALLRGGELVLVVDDYGGSLLDAYARCVTGGRVRRLALDPSVIGLDDLWRQPASGSPTALARAWTAARAHPDRIVLLTIECMETAPIGLWLLAFLAELHGEARPSNLLVAGSLHTARWNDKTGASRLAGMLAPVSQAATSDAWMRAVFRATGLEVPEPPTALDVSGRLPLTKQIAGELVAKLNDVPGLRPAGAIRAARVLHAARCIASDVAAFQLALDLARIASAADTNIGTACLGRGVRLLREIADRVTN